MQLSFMPPTGRSHPSVHGGGGAEVGTGELLHDLFGDPDVTAIVASAGGDHSCHLLPHLDFELMAQNPKVFMGYSDITVLNVAIWQRTGFLETSEEKPSPARLDGILMDYENMGVLSQISGLLVGRPMYYSASEKAALREIVQRRTAGYSFPIVTDMDFGHTAPQFTLPVGCAGRLDSESRTFEVVEPAVV